MEQEVITKLETFISEQFMVSFHDEAGLNSETDLYATSIVDSYGHIELITFMESTFSLSFGDDELFGESMRTVKGMASVIMEKRDV